VDIQGYAKWWRDVCLVTFRSHHYPEISLAKSEIVIDCGLGIPYPGIISANIAEFFMLLGLRWSWEQTQPDSWARPYVRWLVRGRLWTAQPRTVRAQAA
jgi:hypothetical protein